MNAYTQSLLEILQECDPTNTALIFQGRSHTIGQLVSHSSSWANKLSNRIAPGDVVVCDHEDDPFEYVAKFIGIMTAGGIHFSARNVSQTWKRLNDLGTPFCGITSWSLDPSHFANVRFIGDPAGNSVYSNETLPNHDDSINSGRLLETSGSTGEPKWVYWSQTDLLADRLAWVDSLALTNQDVILNLHPLDYAHGMDVHMLSGLLSGAPVVHMSMRNDPADIIRTIADHSITMMSALPSHYTMLAQVSKDSQAGASLRLALTGGAQLSPATVDLVRRKAGIRLKRLYGATEAGIMCADLINEHQSLPALRPMPGVSMKLLPIPGQVSEVTPSIGEPYFSRAHMATQYWGDAQRTQKTFSGGWYKSGDAVRVQQDGSIEVLGRAEDVWIDANSRKLMSSGAVSARLAEVDGIDEVVVIPPGSCRGEVTTIFCVIAPQQTMEQMRERIELALDELGLAAILYLCSDWPRSLVGKPDRRAILAWA